MKNSQIYYSVGALLYCPANQKNIVASLQEEKFGTRFSLALCLEDTINDNFVEEAENILVESLKKIYISYQKKNFYLPKIFIRIRNSGQIPRLVKALGQACEILTGFIIPKFSPSNSQEFIQAIISANETSAGPIYMMPIYESGAMIDLRTRYEILYQLKDDLDAVKDRVLNIRVGGNDLCHIFGFRRHANESIHRIAPVANIFSDIITVYGSDYCISGPVWEYYSGENWESGLRSEIADDKLCGFIGKTVIHPNQIRVVNEEYQVNRTDFNDAQEILNWNQTSNAYVSGNHARERMNEYKTHTNWAQQTLYLAQTFGIREDGASKNDAINENPKVILIG